MYSLPLPTPDPPAAGRWTDFRRFLLPPEGFGLPNIEYLRPYWIVLYGLLGIGFLFDLGGHGISDWIALPISVLDTVIFQALAWYRPAWLQRAVAGHMLVLMVILAWLARQPDAVMRSLFDAPLLHAMFHLSFVFALATFYWIPGALVGCLLSVALFPGANPGDWALYAFALGLQTISGVWVNYALRAERRMALRLEYHSQTDWLTGLPNRRAFETALDELRDKPGAQVAIMVIDLNGFKAINDAHGQAEGDAVLRRIGDVLRANVRAGDTIYRFGGDEFAVLSIPPPRDTTGFGERYRTLVRGITTPHAGPLDLSYGMAIYPTEAADIEAAWRLADARMYARKVAGREMRMLEG
jgi:diguanylate cyclase (GGDEF)-like protein